ncbi:MAG: HAMP domain-containing histidine kinase [Trueperaceae bacterium]|nr:MAG: HAMP domain-containing histidine kinase [Trueperaceae bacterium]
MGRRTPPQSATRIAFGVITVFVLAQVVWWIVFQQRYIGSVTRERLAAWQRDAAAANLALEAQNDAGIRQELERRYPHLSYDGGAFVIRASSRESFQRKQEGYLRMFAYEGSFFVLVTLGGLAFIGLSLRAERDLKERQQNFLGAITHEFKTPLSTLRLLVETALMRPLDPAKRRDYLMRMETELARLEQTSEQALASARLEQAEDPPVLSAEDLNLVVERIVQRSQAGLEARGAKLTVEYAPVPLPVSIDEAAFSVVLNNLLDNAVKYSPDESKPVRVGLEAKKDLVLTHVSDEGIGVKETEVKRIFEQFYRTGNEMTRTSKGVGLGLHLVKRITEAMNGWVRVEANPESRRGSRFTVVLPKRVGLDHSAQPTDLQRPDTIERGRETT